eukprot:3183913-Amphidinium_carterae.1
MDPPVEEVNMALRRRPSGTLGMSRKARVLVHGTFAAGIQPNHVTCSILLKNVHQKSKALEPSSASPLQHLLKTSMSSCCDAVTSMIRCGMQG